MIKAKYIAPLALFCSAGCATLETHTGYSWTDGKGDSYAVSVYDIEGFFAMGMEGCNGSLRFGGVDDNTVLLEDNTMGQECVYTIKGDLHSERVTLSDDSACPRERGDKALKLAREAYGKYLRVRD